MLERLLFRYSGRLPCRLIQIEDRPYLERYYIGKYFGWTFYLHRFVSGDAERNVHDHPWRLSLSFILRGQYEEERLRWLCPDSGWVSYTRQCCWYKPNLIRGDTFHRITAPKPETWTLFIHGKRVKGWGFLSRPSDGNGTLYQQPYDMEVTRNWHQHAPLGCEINRIALPPA